MECWEKELELIENKIYPIMQGYSVKRANGRDASYNIMHASENDVLFS